MFGLRTAAFGAVMAAAALVSPGLAQPVQFTAPAETPPASYEARTYVDTRGCVYARAQVGGVTRWAPVVGSNRKPVCGQIPSLSRTNTTAQPEFILPAPVRPQMMQPVPPASSALSVATPSGPSAQPDAAAPLPARGARSTPTTRIVPRHVYEAQPNALPPTPKGYRLAWEDDRLNPHRAQMTRDGHRATQQVWSNTVPRTGLRAAQPIKEPVIVGRGTVLKR